MCRTIHNVQDMIRRETTNIDMFPYAIRSSMPETSGRFWAVSDVIITDDSGERCLCFRKVIGWATVLEVITEPPQTGVRPVVLDNESGDVELTYDRVIELDGIPPNAEVQAIEQLGDCPITPAVTEFYITWPTKQH
ncbi:hypothetical protein SODG_001743 [Sodalis praecaptivus]|uniref:hypothetical protein n=1 Tax=Sodalis praecaptivus TaxID=1239307 RepID=UPI0027F85EF4|nr:hypothetical protein [Sodalis praecaptivus]CAJ0995425.1 hypothetical protein NVIRENTERO_01904 [Sodalis praecaptivus]